MVVKNSVVSKMLFVLMLLLVPLMLEVIQTGKRQLIDEVGIAKREEHGALLLKPLLKVISGVEQSGRKLVAGALNEHASDGIELTRQGLRELQTLDLESLDLQASFSRLQQVPNILADLQSNPEHIESGMAEVNELLLNFSHDIYNNSGMVLAAEYDIYYLGSVAAAELVMAVATSNDLMVSIYELYHDKNPLYHVGVKTHAYIGQVSKMHKELVSTVQYNPALQNDLRPMIEAIEGIKSDLLWAEKANFTDKESRDNLKKFFQQISKYQHKLDKMGTDLGPLLYDVLEEKVAKKYKEYGIHVALVGACLLVALVVAYRILTSIKRDLNIASEVASNIAHGQLDNDVVIRSQDETGRLLESMVSMQQMLKDHLEEQIASQKAIELVKQALDNVTGNVMVTNADNTVSYLNQAALRMFQHNAQIIRQGSPSFTAEQINDSSIESVCQMLQLPPNLFTGLRTQVSDEYKIGACTLRYVANPILTKEGDFLGAAIEWIDRTPEVAVENEIQSLVKDALAGDLKNRASLDGKQGFFLGLSKEMNALLGVFDQVVDDTLRVLTSLAQGDLRENIQTDYDGAFNDIKNNANSTLDSLNHIISNIQKSAVEVKSGAKEIATGNAELSQRTESQAASLQETAASMEEMAGTVQQNADSARQADELASSAKECAEKGGSVVKKAINGMTEINTASEKIGSIINVINEIAFQTNLLALNAAVEAARAGEQGQGFAVVAGEVRNLAQRSASAAREIEGLIKNSIDKVGEGSRLVDESGRTLDEIVEAVQRVSNIIANIACAGQEQSQGISQVTQAVAQMDEMVQQNTALVEEAATASDTMDEQARALTEMTQFFSLRQSNEQEYMGWESSASLTMNRQHPSGHGARSHGRASDASTSSHSREMEYRDRKRGAVSNADVTPNRPLDNSMNAWESF